MKLTSGLKNILGDTKNYRQQKVYQTDLSSIILASASLNGESNETLDLYFSLLEKYAQRIEASKESLLKASGDFYAELLSERKGEASRSNII